MTMTSNIISPIAEDPDRVRFLIRTRISDETTTTRLIRHFLEQELNLDPGAIYSHQSTRRYVNQLIGDVVETMALTSAAARRWRQQSPMIKYFFRLEKLSSLLHLGVNLDTTMELTDKIAVLQSHLCSAGLHNDDIEPKAIFATILTAKAPNDDSDTETVAHDSDTETVELVLSDLEGDSVVGEKLFVIEDENLITEDEKLLIEDEKYLSYGESVVGEKLFIEDQKYFSDTEKLISDDEISKMQPRPLRHLKRSLSRDDDEVDRKRLSVSSVESSISYTDL